MGNGNWNKNPKDRRAPNPPKDEIVKPHKKNPPKKIYQLECRWKKWRRVEGEGDTPHWEEWKAWKRYPSKKSRDEAFKALNKSHKNWEFIQFRLPPEDEKESIQQEGNKEGNAEAC